VKKPEPKPPKEPEVIFVDKIKPPVHEVATQMSQRDGAEVELCDEEHPEWQIVETKEEVTFKKKLTLEQYVVMI